MGFYTGGKSRAISSPRHLTLRHARRTVYQHRKAKELLSLGEEDDGPDLPPGYEKLNSYWAPGLVAGPQYTITADQTVTAPAPTSDQPLHIVSKQPFTVDAPQFSLPEGSVYSVYPPPGYAEEHRILPNVVLGDPHLPWERIGSPSTIHVKDTRNRVPWLVLITFTQEELKLAPGSLGQMAFKQTDTLSIKMKVSEVRNIVNVSSPLTDSMGANINDQVGEFVFLKPDLFRSLFSTFDEKNQRQDKPNPVVDQYKYLAHVRKINTTGMAIAGREDVGIFSIVVGNRAGPLHNKVPVTVAAHLLSIEGVEAMKFPGQDKQYVSLCSLHSWNYTVLMPDAFNVFDAFKNLGDNLSVLRPPQKFIEPLKTQGRVQDRLAKRLEDGYSLIKYRTQTGESTVALYRGPLCPTVVPCNPRFDTCSNSGQDFQILDQEVGIMDVTYSSAWNLGRVLAAGDQSFTAALTRLRATIHRMAMKQSKLAAVQDVVGTKSCFRTSKNILASLKTTVDKLNNIYQPHVRDDGHGGNLIGGDGPQIGPRPYDRWFRPRLGKGFPVLGLFNPLIGDDYSSYAVAAAAELAESKDGAVYDETNDPVSTDWMVVLAWVMDRMFLAGLPAHYLISDPSHLEPETLRFFYIDPNWVDAMIDGALSLGNDQGTDTDRQAIKAQIKQYIESIPANQPHRPQVPTYGFYLRSEVVTRFPDLKVETLPAPPKGQRPERAPLLRHDIVTDGVMMGLFDRVPGSNEFTGLTFTQPPHQQMFAAANQVTKDRASITIRKQYTVPQEIREMDKTRHETLQPLITDTPSTPSSLFLWNTVPKSVGQAAAESAPATGDDEANEREDDLRMINTPVFAQKQLTMLKDPEKGVGTYPDADGQTQKYFDDHTPNSALFAMQLTDPIFFLQVDFKQSESSLPVAALASLQPPPRPSSIPSSTTGQAEIRSLQTLKGSSVPRLYPPPTVIPVSAPIKQGRFVGPTELVTSSESVNQPPAPLSHVPVDAPHVRSITTTETHEPLSSQHGPEMSTRSVITALGDGIANPPSFNCNVFSLGDSAVYLDRDRLPQDLVFSVKVTNQEFSNHQLKEFDIAVPLGPTTTYQMNLLMDAYTGPGPRMLSNLRFNVVASITHLNEPKIKCLMLRLIPRSSKKYIVMNTVFDLDFLLCLAKLNVYEAKMREVKIYTFAYYTHTEKAFKNDFTAILWNMPPDA